MSSVDLTFSSNKRPAELLRDALAAWAAPLSDQRYRLTGQDASGVIFERVPSTWIMVIQTLIFAAPNPLFDNAVQSPRIVVTVQPGPHGRGSVLHLKGRASRRVRRIFDRRSI